MARDDYLEGRSIPGLNTADEGVVAIRLGPIRLCLGRIPRRDVIARDRNERSARCSIFTSLVAIGPEFVHA